MALRALGSSDFSHWPVRLPPEKVWYVEPIPSNASSPKYPCVVARRKMAVAGWGVR